MPLWKDPQLLADDAKDYGHRTPMRGVSPQRSPDASACTATTSSRPTRTSGSVTQEQNAWPVNVDPLERDLKRAGRAQRARAPARWRAGRSGRLRAAAQAGAAAAQPGNARGSSSPWPLRREHLYLLRRRLAPGLSPAARFAAVVAPEDVEPPHDPIRSRRRARWPPHPSTSGRIRRSPRPPRSRRASPRARSSHRAVRRSRATAS